MNSGEEKVMSIYSGDVSGDVYGDVSGEASGDTDLPTMMPPLPSQPSLVLGHDHDACKQAFQSKRYTGFFHAW